MCFFIIAAVISLFVTFAYYVLLKNQYFKMFQLNPYADDATSGVNNDENEVEESKNKGWCWFIQNLWSELVAVFLTPFITLALFPGLVAQIRSSSSNEVWAEQYFISGTEIYRKPDIFSVTYISKFFAFLIELSLFWFLTFATILAALSPISRLVEIIQCISSGNQKLELVPYSIH